VTSLLPATLVAFVAALALVRLLLVPDVARLVLDVPNDRSLHAVPTPRTGGVGLLLAAGTAWLLLGGGDLTPTAALAAALGAIFLVDDMRGLSVSVRFGGQLAVASLFVLSIDPHGSWLLPFLVIGIVWCMNLYNFMDGANGLAGGMAAIGFAAYAVAAHISGAESLAIAAAIIAGAALGFLAWNFDPARIFLGDAGSIPLGFLAAALGIHGWHGGAWPFWFPMLVFSPFAVDASLTLLQRAWRRERLSQAHKSHYYQRLVRAGWSHRKLALAEYGLMLAAGASALVAKDAGAAVTGGLIAAWCLAYIIIAVAIDRRWAAAQAGGASSHRSA
jgi:UDP-N-acetylmuramyl pentapeptide phosphotransferase/UDP-N-acetylglucosamine-1-phosphate transferase